MDTRIQTRINVKYNKPDIFILDKVKKGANNSGSEDKEL